MKARFTQSALALAFCLANPLLADLRISEFMASNSSTLADEDGEFSDWIEIENTGPETLNLANWQLTDQDRLSPESLWTFPSRELAAGERLVVFASSKDRKPGGNGELHTNFQLDADGEYLALIAPDGVTVATQFSPAYPKQRSDISYGFGQAGLASETLIAEGDNARVIIPADNNDGRDWTGSVASFDDSGWLPRQSGIGFELGGTPGGFTLIDQFDSLDLGELDGQGSWNSPTTGAEIAIDPENPENLVLAQTGANVRSWKSLPIANNSTATLFFRMRRDGTVNSSMGATDVPSPGTAFGDFEAQLNNQNDDLLNARDAGAFDPLETFEADTWYDVWMVLNLTTDTYEIYMKGGSLTSQTQLDDQGQTAFGFRNGPSANAIANFFVRTGSPSTGTFYLDDIYLGDGLNLGNPAGSPGLTDFISDNGNIESGMSGINPSAYLRVPFTSPDSASFSSLTLRMRYDDGFVAYLNGVEIAARNAPLVLTWNSAATADHPAQESIKFEEIDITLFQNLLRPTGQENILAIHGLNLSASDRDFLITPILEGLIQDENAGIIFFTSPTPGEANGGGILGFVRDTEFSIDRGFYDTPIELVISSDSDDATIVYTLDGSTPSLTNGTQASGSATLTISETTPVRAAAFKSGYLQTDVDTQTYLFLNDIISQENFPAGYPTTLKGDGGNGSVPADYAMDPEITESAAYRDVMDDALLGVPTISIVTDQENLFDRGTGIYQNPQQSGSAWERPTSVEFIRPDGKVENRQLNAGLRIQGGHTRLPSKNPKHSFRLSFKDEFGPKSLNYELFPGDDGATQKFDQLILRGAGNQSWLHHNTFQGDNRGRAQYIRDQWAKDTQLAMSGIGIRSLYAHLYINGIYWGLYNPTERASAGFGESYLGGSKDDYNALNAGDAIDGQAARAEYLRMITIANGDLSDPAKYMQMQEVLDLEAFTDYMILNQYGGNLDWDHHNWYAIQNSNGGKWYFLCWDSEFIFISPNDNVLSIRNNDDPSGIWMNLMENAEYRLLFADKVQQHLTNEGLLTPGSTLERWDLRKNEMFEAIVGESARWGDYRRDVAPVGPPSPIPLYDRDGEWTVERNRLLTQYFPVRTANVLQQYRQAGYLPALGAPEFDLSPGRVVAGAPLQITGADGGTIYYTLDGSDPRIPAQVGSLDLISEGHAMKTFVPVNDALDPLWRGGNEPFDDSSWSSGTAAGFETSSTDYTSFFDIDTKSEMLGISPSCYVRMTFTIPDQATLDSVSKLTLGVRYDDGFAAFINGIEVTSDNVPNPLTWNGTGGSHSDTLAVIYQPFTLPLSALQALKVGTNVLALHSFNANINSSDFLIDAILSAETRTEAAPSPTALTYAGAITINQSALVKARVRNGDEWSALNSGTFFTAMPAAAGSLVISELMYHPMEESEAEFVELQNISTEILDLSGVFFSEGIDFTFPFGTSLNPGERVLLVRNPNLFESIYGSDLFVAGAFQNDTALSNSGEQITLKANDGSLIESFTYKDSAPWPSLADGGGASLVLRKPAANPNPGSAASWRASAAVGGNPGTSDGTAFSGIATADEDGDGLTALMEYALGTSDNDPSDKNDSLVMIVKNGTLTLQLREAIEADDAALTLEVSEDLRSWGIAEDHLKDASQSQVSEEFLKTSYPITDPGKRQFFRLKVKLR